MEKHTLPPLNVIVMMLAKLDSFLGRKHDKFPGPQLILIGLQRLRDFMWVIQNYQIVMLLCPLLVQASNRDVYKDECWYMGIGGYKTEKYYYDVSKIV